MTAEPTPLQTDPSDESYFRPRARLVSLLGEQLIRDSAVGLVELVKNAYDADATTVDVALNGLADLESTTIVVRDNGHGMSVEEVREYWLSPATGHKKHRKSRAERTPMGRQLLGEKGVGRFAVQRLGKKVELVTKREGEQEVRVLIDWGEFEEAGAFLDEVPVEIVTCKRPRVFTDGTSGTELTMRGAREQWTGTELRKVQRMLRRLQNPVRGKNEFHVTVTCPEHPNYEAVDPSQILETSHYHFSGVIDEEGCLEWDYASRLPDAPHRTNSGVDRLQDVAANELTGTTPACGPFRLQLYVWDRSRDRMRASGLSDRELDSYCGISIYRDDFRVLPYGEAGDDWLSLDARRINVPSKRVGNRNIIGVVEIAHDTNPELRDKTSREGLLENHAYEDLKALVRASIATLEVERLRDKSVGGRKSPAESIFPLFEPRALENGTSNAKKDDVSGSVLADEERLEKEARHLLTRRLGDVRKETQHQALLDLAAQGLRLDRLGHEFSRQVQGANDVLARLQHIVTEDEEALQEVDALRSCLGVLRNAMRDLVPDGHVAQRERTATATLDDLVATALRLNSPSLQKHQVEVRLAGSPADFEIRARPSVVVQVLDNLFDNAIWWMHALPEDEQRLLLIDCDAERGRILIGDSGPGVALHDRERIFEPYFSKRPDGHGLGLYICQERLSTANAHLYLLDSSEPAALHERGATFCVQFPSTRR
jgi:signal transduction histidine kinase